MGRGSHIGPSQVWVKSAEHDSATCIHDKNQAHTFGEPCLLARSFSRAIAPSLLCRHPLNGRSMAICGGRLGGCSCLSCILLRFAGRHHLHGHLLPSCALCQLHRRIRSMEVHRVGRVAPAAPRALFRPPSGPSIALQPSVLPAAVQRCARDKCWKP